MREKFLVGLGVVAVLIVAVIFSQHRRPSNNPLGAGVQARLDSVVVTQPDFQNGQDSIKKVIDSLNAAVHHQDKQVVQDFIYVQADSQLLREAKDSRDSLTAALSLVSSLTTENRDLIQQVSTLEQDTLRLRLIDVRDSSRLEAVERLNRDVAAAVKNVDRCRVAFVIPCPDRTESFALGAVLSGVAIVAASKKF